MNRQCWQGLIGALLMLVGAASGCDIPAEAQDLAVEWTDPGPFTSETSADAGDSGDSGDWCDTGDEPAGQACSGHCRAGIDPKDETKLTPVPDLVADMSQCPSGQKCKFGKDACKNKSDGDASEAGECKSPTPTACGTQAIE